MQGGEAPRRDVARAATPHFCPQGALERGLGATLPPAAANSSGSLGSRLRPRSWCIMAVLSVALLQRAAAAGLLATERAIGADMTQLPPTPRQAPGSKL